MDSEELQRSVRVRSPSAIPLQYLTTLPSKQLFPTERQVKGVGPTVRQVKGVGPTVFHEKKNGQR